MSAPLTRGARRAEVRLQGWPAPSRPPHARARTSALLALAGALFAASASAAPSDVVNVATCSYASRPGADSAPVDPAPPDGLLRAVSNPVVTPVVPLACSWEIGLEVDPPGTVAPGTSLAYSVRAVNRGGVGLTAVVLRLALDPGLTDPSAFTHGTVPVVPSGQVAVSGRFDASTREVVWTVEQLAPGEGITVRADSAVRGDVGADSVVVANASVTQQSCADQATAAVETPVVPPLLAVTKVADRPTASPGDGIVFEIRVAHTGASTPLTSVDLVDDLPAELRFARGTVRIDGRPAPDPTVAGNGTTLTIPLGTMDPGASRSVRLGAIVGPASRADEVRNHAHAAAITAGGHALVSPVATAVVKIEPGVFRREAFLVGRVFVDDDGDGAPGASEPGVPGALVLLEDGRGAITDVSGRWHVEGVRPGLHAVRIDPSTLPESLAPRSAGAEWAGDRGTRFVEARAAELVVADLPVGPPHAPRCLIASEGVRVEIPSAVLLGSGGTLSPGADAHLDAVAALLRDRGREGAPISVSCADAGGAGTPGETTLRERLERRLGVRDAAPPGATLSPFSAPVEEPAAPASAAASDPLEQAVRVLPAEPLILSPAAGTRASRSGIPVEVVYPIGSRPELRVGDKVVAEDRVGTTTTLPSRGIVAARYVGVPLAPGSNTLSFRAVAPGLDAASVRPVEAIVYLPGAAVEIRLSFPEGPWRADGVTPGVLRVETVDSGGTRTSEATLVTLGIEGASPTEADADPGTDGFQVRLEDGFALVRLAPRVFPGRVHVMAIDGTMEAEFDGEAVPADGPWRVLGLATVQGATDGGIEGDGGLPPGADDGISGNGGRLAVFARGPVGDASRLVVSLDTARERDPDRLFERYEPDLFYPAPGDSSVRTDEASRQGPFFARLDGPRGYVLAGDFSSAFDRSELARYDRRLPGVAGRLGAGPFSVEAFASSSDQQSVRDVFQPDGTSGPFLLSRRPLVARSESVAVEVRDRYTTDRVLSREIRTPDLDYSLDPDAGTILFRGPIAPFDPQLNPVRVVVIYETRAGGDEQLVAGSRISVRPSEALEAGATAVREGRAGSDLWIVGADVAWRPFPGTLARAEVAQSSQDGGTDRATRVEVASRAGPNLEWDLSWRDLPLGFANPSFLGSPELGSRRAAGNVRWSPSERWRVKAEAYSQEDLKTDLTRRAAGVEVERRFRSLSVMGGLRGVASSSPTLGDASSEQAEAAIRGKLSRRWTGELLRAQDLGEVEVPGYPTRTAAGLACEIRDGLRLLLRQEIESGDGPQRNRTSASLESRLTPTTKALARYALEEGAGGAALRATAGVETLLPLSRFSTVGLSAFRLDTTQGDDRGDYGTLAGAYEYRAGVSLFAVRYELRLGRVDDRHLVTLSGALRPRDPWTLFGRERLSLTNPADAAASSRAEGLFGAAYRPAGGRWQFLARVEHSTASGSPATPAGIASGGVISEPSASVETPVPEAEPPGAGIGAPRAAPAVLRDSVALSFATGVRITPRQRLGATAIARSVASDPSSGLPSTLTDFLSIHYTAEVAPRWTVGGSARRFEQRETRLVSRGAGLEVGYLAMRNLWVNAGYNLAGFSDPVYGATDRTDRGPFVSLRFKFDEASLADWRDMRLDRP